MIFLVVVVVFLYEDVFDEDVEDFEGVTVVFVTGFDGGLYTGFDGGL